MGPPLFTKRRLPAAIPEGRIAEIAELLRREEGTAILVGDQVMGSESLGRLASRIAAGTGARLIGNRAAARVSRGAGRPVVGTATLSGRSGGRHVGRRSTPGVGRRKGAGGIFRLPRQPQPVSARRCPNPSAGSRA